MLLSTQTEVVFRRVGIERGIALFADAGFDALDFTMSVEVGEDNPLDSSPEEVLAFARRLRALAGERGLRWNQAHAPFPPLRWGDDDYNRVTYPRVQNAIRIAGAIGADAVIVHPIIVPGGAERQRAENLAFYEALAPLAREARVKIALENMWGTDTRRGCIVANVCSLSADFIDYIDRLDPAVFTVCLDLGHCALVGEEPEDAIRALGGRIGALHVHDNTCRADSHTIPFDMVGKLHWEAITAALREVGYAGDFTLEADGFLLRFPAPLLPPALALMAQTGRYLMGMTGK